MIDFKELLIFYLSENTLLLELVEELGMEKAVRFISIFGGHKIEIPSREVIRDKIIGLIIFTTLIKNENNREKTRRLSRRFNFTEEKVRSIFKKIKADFNNSILKSLMGKYAEADKTDWKEKDLEKFILQLL